MGPGCLIHPLVVGRSGGATESAATADRCVFEAPQMERALMLLAWQRQ